MLLDDILELPRWQPLKRFVSVWYRDPLGMHACAWDDVLRAEKNLGVRMPPALREWFVLAAGRFADVNQDRAVRLENIAVRSGWIPFWWENQGVWSIQVEPNSQADDPRVRVDGDVFHEPPLATVSEALLGMVYSDTIVGVWSSLGVGPLGPLRHSVVGGLTHENVDFQRVSSQLPLLDVYPNPYWDESPRGHDTLVVRGGECMAHIEWMAATAEAVAQLTDVLGEIPGSSVPMV